MFMQMLENMQNTILQICKYNVWSIPNMQNIQNWKYEKCKCADYAKHAKCKMKNVYFLENMRPKEEVTRILLWTCIYCRTLERSNHEEALYTTTTITTTTTTTTAVSSEIESMTLSCWRPANPLDSHNRGHGFESRSFRFQSNLWRRLAQCLNFDSVTQWQWNT